MYKEYEKKVKNNWELVCNVFKLLTGRKPMNKKIFKKIMCFILTTAMLITSVSLDTVRSIAATNGNSIIDGEYTTGIFAGSYGIDQLFDYIMSTGRLNNLPYDASWGHANASTGHQFTKNMMKDRHFVLKY